jgi:PTS system nitrogen regulatory IIA component
VRKNQPFSLALITASTITLNLKGKTKESIINELLDMLVEQDKLLNRETAFKDLMEREQTMSTAIPNGIAIPHAKTAAVKKLTIAIGIKKSGIDLDSPLDDKSRIIILALVPPDKPKPLYEFLVVITTALSDDAFRSKILTATTPDEVISILYNMR